MVKRGDSSVESCCAGESGFGVKSCVRLCSVLESCCDNAVCCGVECGRFALGSVRVLLSFALHSGVKSCDLYSVVESALKSNRFSCDFVLEYIEDCAEERARLCCCPPPICYIWRGGCGVA